MRKILVSPLFWLFFIGVLLMATAIQRVYADEAVDKMQRQMFGVPEPPQQWLALVHERWGLRERVPIVLEDPKTATRPRIRVPAGMVVS